MSRRNKTTEMVTKSKRVLSTPDHTLDSPSRDSDSMCESETASPVPFLCTQDGAEGITDVVWNYYSSNTKNSHLKNSTPISKKARKSHRLKLPEKKPQATQPKRTRLTQKMTQLPLELLELNQYVDKLMEEKSKSSNIVEKPQSGSEEDIFADARDHSPKSIFRTKKCLRKNVLSSRFNKPQSETGLDSDDSINECLLIASQAVEENILSNKKPTSMEFNVHPGPNLSVNDDSMDAMFNGVKSPYANKFKCESPGLKNDSFDSLLGNLNDSALERLSHMPVTNRKRKDNDKSKLQDTSWNVEEVFAQNSSPSTRFSFTRHSSMPESPSLPTHNKSTISNALALGRYNSMPFNDSNEKETGDSPVRCTPLEIQKKRQLAREKLLAKRLLPFTQTHQSGVVLPSQSNEVEKPCKFVLKVPTVSSPKKIMIAEKPEQSSVIQKAMGDSKDNVDIRSLIEKKRQEALMKLRRKQLQKYTKPNASY